jgi:hypothetical protein
MPASAQQPPSHATRTGSASRAPRRRSVTPAVAPVLSLQAGAGNRAVTALLAGGAPLPPDTRADMESRFGTDFGSVRVHDDSPAHTQAAALHAKAFTHGEHIVFSANRFAPQAGAGRRLLAHELAHVVQQRRGGSTPVLDAQAPHEHAADAAAGAVAAGQAQVSVAGATGVGVALDEEEGWSASLRRKYREAKEAIPPEYRDKMQKAADIAADASVTVLTALLGPLAMYESYGAGSAMLHGAQKAAAGEAGATEEIKGFVRDQAMEQVGVVKGVVTQVTEVVDTGMWFGNEYNKGRDAVAETAGPKGSLRHTVAKKAIDLTATALGLGVLPQMGEADTAAKELGLVDKTGQASLTAPMSRGAEAASDWLEENVGGKPTDPFVFTPLERGELKGAIGSQVALSFVGATEVKVALGVIGLAGSIRSVVETVRADPNGFYKQPAFWSGVLTGVLSVVGLANLKAGKRIIDMAIQGGTVLSVVPHVWKLYQDYYDPKVAALPEQERHEVLAQDWQALLRAMADVLIAIAHAGANGRPTPRRKGGLNENVGAPPGSPESLASGKTGESTTGGGKTADAAGGTGGKATGGVEGTPGGGPDQAPVKQPSARTRKSAAKKAAADEKAAAKQNKSAAGKKETAEKALQRAKKLAEKADEARAAAEKKAQEHRDKQAHAEAKKDSPAKTQQKAKTQEANARKRMGDAKDKAGAADAAAKKADAAAKKAAADSKSAKVKADRAKAKADKSRARVEALKPPVDPQTVFDPNDPAFAPAPDATLAPNQEPVVWVSFEQGPTRGSYVVEGGKGFGKGEGTAMPLSHATEAGFRPSGTPFEPQKIAPVKINGRQVESAGAGGDKGKKFVSATGREPEAVNKTSIPADVSEAGAYQHHLQNGEIGILRPQGSNAPGADSITAQVKFDANGRPVSAKLLLNDATTPTAGKGPKASHTKWGEALKAALDPNAPAGRKLDLGDPALEAVIRKAAADGEVYIRIVRVEPTPAGKLSVKTSPKETWKLGPLNIPFLRPMVAPPEREQDGEEGKAAP